MKRILSIVLAFCLILCLAGCDFNLFSGGSEKEDDVKNVVEMEYFDLEIPDSWAGKIVVEKTKDSTSGKSVYTFYDKYTKEETNAGKEYSIGRLFSFNLEENKGFYGVVPGARLIGEIEIDKKYYISARFPTDVQFAEGDAKSEESYTKLLKEARTVVRNISSDKYDLTVYPYDKENSTEIIGQQAIIVSSSGSNATLTLKEYINNKWVETFSCYAVVGKDGVINAISEGLKATPAGTFDVLFAFGTANISTKLKYKTLTGGEIWIDDPNSAYYNTLQNRYAAYADWNSYEDIYYQFTSGLSTCCIAFDFNGDCESKNSAYPGAGSVIFIDGKPGVLSPTYGDIAISSNDMSTLVSRLDQSKNPYIYIN